MRLPSISIVELDDIDRCPTRDDDDDRLALLKECGDSKEDVADVDNFFWRDVDVLEVDDDDDAVRGNFLE